MDFYVKEGNEMALADRKKNIVMPYPLDDTFQNLKKAMLKLGGFKIYEFNENEKTVYLESGISWVSWGEMVTISLTQEQNSSTIVSIISTPKTGIYLGGLIDFGKNRENIERIEQALLDELTNHTE